MISWKVVLAGIIFLYLFLASVLSLLVHYAAVGTIALG
jgi:hypothetical protein